MINSKEEINMFKGILCILLSFIMVFSASASSDIPLYKETEAEAVLSKEAVILERLGVIEADFDYEKEITRRDFAVYLAEIAGYSDIKGNSFENIIFSDIKKGDKASGSIQLLSALNVIRGTGDGLFRPDEKILYRDAVVLLVRLLGYDVYAEANGGYPTGYLLTASSEKITSGIASGMDESINGTTLSRLLFNALSVKIKLRYSYGNESLKMKDGETLGVSVFNLYKKNGIVEANGYTGLGSAGDAVSEGSVVIDGYIYNGGSTDISEKLGMNTEFWFIDETKEKGISEIIYYENKYDEKTHITLSADQILSVSENTIIFNGENGKERELSYNGNTYVLYNGIAHPSYKKEDIIPEAGSVTLTDSDADGIFDVISIEEYKDYLVSSVSENLGRVGIEGGEAFNFFDSNIGYTVIRDGKECEFSEIYPGDVVSVFESKDGKYIRIIVSSDYVEGDLGETGEDESGAFVIIGSYRFYLSKTGGYLPEVGKNSSWLLNFRGEIFDEAQGNEGIKFGYLMRIASQGVVDKTYKFKILTSRGIGVYSPAKKLSLNGGTALDPEKIATDNAFYVNGALDESGARTEQQLIRYKLDENGMLTHIDTVTDISGEAIRKDKEDERFTLDYKTASGGQLTYRSGTRALGTRFLVNASTPIFEVPTVYSSNDEQFNAYNITRLVHDKAYYDVEIYSADHRNIAGAVIMRTASKGAANIENWADSVIITKVSKVFEEGQQGTKISGVLRGIEISYISFDNELGDYDSSYGNGVLFSELKPGDVVQVTNDYSGKANQMRLLYRYDGNPQFKLSATESVNYMNMGLMSSVGKLISSTDTSVIVNCKDGVSIDWDRSFMKDSRTHFYIFDTKTEKLIEVSPADIDPGVWVYLRGSYSALYDLIWYK